MMRIRKVRGSDLETIDSLEKNCFGAYTWPASAFHEYMRRDGVTFLLATIDGIAAGYCVAQRVCVTSLSLMVRRDNSPTIQLYRRSGFRRVRTSREYYEDGTAGWHLRLLL